MARKFRPLFADNLVQGISQQIEERQTLNHCRDRLNIHPSIVHGNTKRPPVRFRSRLQSAAEGSIATHTYERDSDEQYVVVITGDNIRVFDSRSGREFPVSFPDGRSYLDNSVDASDAYRFLTLADYTFICNRYTTVRMSSKKSPKQQNQALLYVKRGDYGVTYQIYLNGTLSASYTTGSETVEETATDRITRELMKDLQARKDGDPNHLLHQFNVNATNTAITVERWDGNDFNVTTTDGLASEAFIAVRDSVQRFSDLPNRAPHGFVVKVAADGERSFDAYYVRFEAHDKGARDSEGVWVETVAPDVSVELAAHTMPHVLVRQEDGSFEFRRSEWGDREAGDDKSNRPPSFVGQKIEGMFFFQNRLGFLSGANAITSRTSEYFDFWKTTARTKLDTDPVDIAATTSQSAKLRYALPFDDRLVIFADTAQLLLTGGQTFTPNNAALTLTSSYTMDFRTAPVVVGESIFFAAMAGDFVSIRELRSSQERDRTFAVTTTDHVPKLIPRGSYKLIGSEGNNTLIVSSLDPNSNAAFSYNWLWADRERVISSWGRVRFASATLIGGAFVEDELRGLFARNGVLTLGVASYQTDGTFDGTRGDTFLDFSFMPEASYDPATDETRLRCLLYHDVETILARTDGHLTDISNRITRRVGRDFSYGSEPIMDIYIKGEWSNLIVGSAYLVQHVFSTPYPQKYGPRGEMMADLAHRFQLTSLSLNLADSGPFTVTVQRPSRADYVATFTGLPLREMSPRVGVPPISSGDFKVTLRGRSDELKITLASKSWMPLNFTSAEWRGSRLRNLR